MAASSEHGSARIKVQVVATLLPLHVPVHVDPFWALIRFSESPSICDVESKIVACLNCMGEEYPAELVVHDSPITSSWTYFPTLSTATAQNSSRQHRMAKSGSDTRVSEQQLTIVLRPICKKTGTWIKKVKPEIMISYEISNHLPRSARLMFKSQLIFMHDSVLLSGSKSEILRDNDTVTINAVCYFCLLKEDGTLEGLSSGHVKATPEAESELISSPGDLNENSFLCDADTLTITDTETKLPSEIKTKIDTLLKQLANLQSSNHKEESSSERRKSKKRKANEEDSGSELSNRSLAVSGEIGAHFEEKRKIKKTNVIPQLNSKVVASSDRTGSLFKEKSKLEKMEINSVLSSSFVENPDTSNVEGKRHKKTPVEQEAAEEQMSISGGTVTDNLMTKSKKKKKSKRKVKCDVEVDSLMDTSVSHTTDEINQTVQDRLHVNGKQKEVMQADVIADNVVQTDLIADKVVQADLIADKVVPSVQSTTTPSNGTVQTTTTQSNGTVQSTTTPSNRRAKKLAALGLSNLLTALREQQTCKINSSCNKDNSEIKTQEVDGQRKENQVTEKTEVNFQDTCNQTNLSMPSPLKKRIRKRKNKKSNLDKSTNDKQIAESVVRDYTLKLPEHLMPQNNRVTFECDSDDDASPTVEKPMACDNSEHSSSENITEGTRQSSSQTQEKPKPAKHSVIKSDITKPSPFTGAGAAINPDEKFQTLLNQCGRTARQFETVNSANGHTVIRSSRKKQITVGADGDVVMITQPTSEPKTPTSDVTSHVQCFPAAVVDNNANSPSILKNGRLNNKSLITSTPELKSGQTLVEVTPLYMNYSSCTQLCGVPSEGDIIAYKILEMAEDYTPGLSDFKEAKVIHADANSGSLLLQSRGRDNKKRSGKFELSYSNNDTDSPNEEELVEVNLADLVDTRLVCQADGSQ